MLRLNFVKNYFHFIIIAFLELFVVFWLWLPFLKNNLLAFDLPGHYFNAWFIKEYLFPAMAGWNPFFFAGFPQNLFYPPLFSYLTAALSFILPLMWAFKAIVLLSLILT